MQDLLKNVFLAGVGSMALSYEKSKDLVNDLINKGRITVKQGEQLNEELKRVTKENFSESKDKVEKDIKNYLEGLDLATKEDIENLNKRIDEIKKQN
ncbi:MAG TPA: phasin family protein [Tissierellaceae bacterium]|nr:phasin family protein [Tissierellaceae bacterium]